MTRSTTLAAGLVTRARVVLLAADGVANYEIAERVGVSRPTVNLWRSRYTASGIGGLADAPRPGRARTGLDWMSTMQIREVPEDVCRVLKARAAAAGQSLSDYLLRELTRIAGRPTVAEVAAWEPHRSGHTRW